MFQSRRQFEFSRRREKYSAGSLGGAVSPPVGPGQGPGGGPGGKAPGSSWISAY